MIIGRPIAKVLDIITGILAVMVIAVIGFSYINGTFHFIKSAETLAKLAHFRQVGILAVLGLCGLTFSLRRNIFFFIGFLIIVGVTAFFMFYSGFSFGL